MMQVSIFDDATLLQLECCRYQSLMIEVLQSDACVGHPNLCPRTTARVSKSMPAHHSTCIASTLRVLQLLQVLVQ